MKKLRQSTLVLLGLISILYFSSCAKIFYTPDAKSLAKQHKTIAILPPNISIAAKKKVDVEALKEQQRTESLNFQNEMYSWILKRKMQGKVDQDVQEPATTNALLKKAGYPENTLSTAELCELLGVDGIVSSSFGLSKPMSDGAAVAIGLIGGTWGSTNEVTVTISISDCENTKLIWNYNHKLSRGLGSSPATVVNDIMRNASKKMPYRK